MTRSKNDNDDDDEAGNGWMGVVGSFSFAESNEKKKHNNNNAVTILPRVNEYRGLNSILFVFSASFRVRPGNDKTNYRCYSIYNEIDLRNEGRLDGSITQRANEGECTGKRAKGKECRLAIELVTLCNHHWGKSRKGKTRSDSRKRRGSVSRYLSFVIRSNQKRKNCIVIH